MNSNHYAVYLESIFQLANTLVIKFDKTVQAINEYTELLYPGSVDYQNPSTWKYYLNVSGEYHFRDEPMKVISLDTLEEIVFNKENLEIHRATKRAYAYGSRFYHELVAKYPDQESLILGILYPADINKAISAKNGQIISYPKHLVESNEYSLISNLQKWIDGYIFRWVNEGFSIAHDLYDMTWQSVFYSLLPQTILMLRHEKAKTNEAHSFHVWMYLASHGRLDRYRDNLTKKQALWLYRNILHIKKNLGHTDTFHFLTEHIMTDRNIPLSGYEAKHNLSVMMDHIEGHVDPTSEASMVGLYPQVEFRRKTINGIDSVEVLDPISLRQLLIKEDNIARDNYNVRMLDEANIQAQLENSLSNTIKTKALESTLFDYSGSSPYNLENILLSHWIFLSSKNIYRAFIPIENPRTGDIFNLSVKDAFVFGYYFFCKAFGLELIEVPIVPAIRVQRIPMVGVDDLMKVADKEIIPRSLAELMLSKQPIIDLVHSTEDFNALCHEIFISAEYQRDLVAFQEHHYGRALAQGMISQIYSDNTCSFDVEGKLYSQWFAERNIEIKDYDFVDPRELWNQILSDATGVDVSNANSLANVQRAMTDIMIQLSSYSVQFLNEINGSSLRLAEPLTVRVGDYSATMRHDLHVDHNVVSVIEHKGKNKRILDYDITLCGMRAGPKIKLKESACFDIIVKPQIPLKASRLINRFDLSGVGATIVSDDGINDEGIIPVPGLSTFLAQPESERVRVVDLYDNCYLNQQKP